VCKALYRVVVAVNINSPLLPLRCQPSGGREGKETKEGSGFFRPLQHASERPGFFTTEQNPPTSSTRSQGSAVLLFGFHLVHPHPQGWAGAWRRPFDQRERRAGSKSGGGWPARDCQAHVIARQGGRHPCTNHGCVVDRHHQSPTCLRKLPPASQIYTFYRTTSIWRLSGYEKSLSLIPMPLPR
jgi:hypothetical protein